MVSAADDAKPFDKVVARELQFIDQARQDRGLPATPGDPEAPDRPQSMDLIGLALSGGGIRSATFNLGILQGLADRKMLPHIDYLSTVSGGGYIGSWLVAWIYRARHCNAGRSPGAESTPRQDGSTARAKLDHVELSLQSKVDCGAIGERDPEPIRHLRRFSNFLSPRVSLLNADTWSVAAIWTRNTLLNLLIILCAAIVVLAFPRLLGLAASRFDAQLRSTYGFVAPWIPLLWAATKIGLLLRPVAGKNGGQADDKTVQRTIIVPLTVGALGLSYSLFTEKPVSDNWILWVIPFSIVFVLVTFVGGFNICFSQRHPDGRVMAYMLGLAVSAASGFVTAVALHGVALILEKVWSPWAAVTVGVPFVLLCIAVGMAVHVGLLGSDLNDAAREWLGRLRAWSMIYSFGWLVVTCVSIYSPYLVYLCGGIPAAGAGGVWGALSVVGTLAAKSGETGQHPTEGKVSRKVVAAEVLAHLAPYVFVFGFIVLVSLGIHELARPHGDKGGDSNTCASSPQTKQVSRFEARAANYENDLTKQSYDIRLDLECLGSLTILALFVGGLLAWRVDINDFSMHDFYKNRLVRAYLGASRSKCRHPDRFIGFDNDDDFKLSELVKSCSHAKAEERLYCGPYPVMNCALNVSGGDALAWQERQAAAYIFSPLFCGYDKPLADRESTTQRRSKQVSDFGYRHTSSYAYKEGPSIGTAMAVSGAAASPNMGYHTSSATAFLLTLFNLRLGRWLGNPGRDDKYSRPGPLFGLSYLLVELFGVANTNKAFVNLSDGGHFENLGIYELIRRRCRYVIVGDSEQDQGVSFGGLGNAIRKCRTDFGVDIQLDLSRLRKIEGLSRAHCAVGKIIYPNDAREAFIIYLKATLTGDEPADILQYAADNPDFPHQSTEDQWFDESQFEGYRKLGLHVCDAAFSSVSPVLETDRVGMDYSENKAQYFRSLHNIHYPPSQSIERSFTRHTEKYSRLVEAIAGDPALAYLDPVIFPDWMDGSGSRTIVSRPSTTEEQRLGRYLCSSFIQLMESIFLDLELERPDQRNHPHNAGWLRLFRHWAGTQVFQEAWASTGTTYGLRFQKFYQDLLRSRDH